MKLRFKQYALVFYITLVVVIAVTVSKFIPQSEESQQKKGQALVDSYRNNKCMIIDENTNYITQKKCFRIRTQMYELTGSMDALAAMARYHLHGYGVKKDFAKGLQLMEKVANSGYERAVLAQAALGIYYGAEDSPVKNPAKEEYWVKKAADNGNADSQYRYARILRERGEFNEAIIWYKKAAHNGSLFAKDKLGELFNKGYSVQMNRKQIYQLLHEAAEANHEPAFQELYLLYAADGDCEKARFWHSKLTNSTFFKKMETGMYTEEEAIAKMHKAQIKQKFMEELRAEREEKKKKDTKK
jgi:TPR repeat protein